MLAIVATRVVFVEMFGATPRQLEVNSGQYRLGDLPQKGDLVALFRAPEDESRDDLELDRFVVNHREITQQPDDTFEVIIHLVRAR